MPGIVVRPRSDAVLGRINEYRQAHHARPLDHDSGLEKRAETTAAHMASKPSAGVLTAESCDDPFNAASLVLASSASDADLAIRAIDAWHAQYTKYDFQGRSGHVSARRVCSQWKAADFARLVWRATRRVGVAVARSPGGKRAVVVAMFDPRGLDPLLDVASNVRPPGLDALSLLDDVYTKAQSDGRYLGADRFGDVVEEASSNVSSSVVARMEDVRTELKELYVKKSTVGRLVEGRVSTGFDELRGWIDDSLGSNVSTIQSELAGLRDDTYTVKEVEGLLDDLGVAVDASLDDLASAMITKVEAEDRYAKRDALEDVRRDLYSKYLPIEDIERNFATKTRLDTFTDAVMHSMSNRIEVRFGGTGSDTHARNKIVVGDGSSPMKTPQGLHWDLDSQRLGIHVEAPVAALDVNGRAHVSVGVGTPEIKFLDAGTPGAPALSWDVAVAADDGSISSGSRTGLYLDAKNGSLCFATGGEHRCRVDGNTGFIGVGTEEPVEALHVAGNMYVTGDVVNVSDSRFKTNVRKLGGGGNESIEEREDRCLFDVMRLSGYRFNRSDWTSLGRGVDPDTEFLGFIAQEVKEILPEAVKFDEAHDVYSINYIAVIAVLTEAVKSVNMSHRSMAKDLRRMGSRLERLERKIGTLGSSD